MSRTYFVPRSLHEENLEEAKSLLPTADMGRALREPDGGFSVNPHTGKQPTDGYALSVHPERSKAIPNIHTLSDTQIAHHVKAYHKANKDLFKDPNNHVGAWHDPQTHTGYLDVSTIVKTPEEAHALGKAHDQLAYYDLKGGKSVDIDRNAKSGQK